MTTFDAAPTLTIGGAAVAIGQTADLLAVDALSITWGRASLLEQPTPARASVVLLDRTAGRTMATRTDLIGQRVLVGWSGSDGSAGAVGASFEGRVTDVEVEPAAVRNSAGLMVRAARVTLSCSSLEVDLANYEQAEGTAWPAETVAARRQRLDALMPAGLFTTGNAEPLAGDTWMDAYGAAAVDVSGKTLLDLVRQLNDSTARPTIFNPGGGLGAVRRRVWTAPAVPFTTRLEPVAELGGRYALTSSPIVGARRIAGHRLAPGGGVHREQSSAITRVQINYVAAGTSTTYSLAVPGAPAESVIGRRTLSIDSCLADAAGAAQLAAEWASIVQLEAAAPRLSSMTWRSSEGWWDDDLQRLMMLCGVELPYPLLVEGSWLPELGMTPRVGIIGGTIGYAAGDWTIGLTPAATVHVNAPPGLRGRYAASSSAVRARDLDPSFTFGDAAWAQIGAGFTAATMPTT